MKDEESRGEWWIDEEMRDESDLYIQVKWAELNEREREIKKRENTRKNLEI